MAELIRATGEALALLFALDKDLWAIVAVSFGVSLRAISISAPLALLIAFALAYGNFAGRRLLISLVNTLLAVPTVVIGLLLYMLLSRHGPLGDWRLLFSQSAMVMGQILLSLPILVAMAHSALAGGQRRAWETALTLGASGPRALLTLIHEVRFGLGAALIAGFGRVISEVGCSLVIGGNILNYTRSITTAIALETNRGQFAQGIALGLVLLAVALGLNLILTWLQGRGQAR